VSSFGGLTRPFRVGDGGALRFGVRLASIRGSLAGGRIVPRGVGVSLSGAPLLAEASLAPSTARGKTTKAPLLAEAHAGRGKTTKSSLAALVSR
jgi:hypothetical protein